MSDPKSDKNFCTVLDKLGNDTVQFVTQNCLSTIVGNAGKRVTVFKIAGHKFANKEEFMAHVCGGRWALEDLKKAAGLNQLLISKGGRSNGGRYQYTIEVKGDDVYVGGQKLTKEDTSPRNGVVYTIAGKLKGEDAPDLPPDEFRNKRRGRRGRHGKGKGKKEVQEGGAGWVSSTPRPIINTWRISKELATYELRQQIVRAYQDAWPITKFPYTSPTTWYNMLWSDFMNYLFEDRNYGMGFLFDHLPLIGSDYMTNVYKFFQYHNDSLQKYMIEDEILHHFANSQWYLFTDSAHSIGKAHMILHSLPIRMEYNGYLNGAPVILGGATDHEYDGKDGDGKIDISDDRKLFVAYNDATTISRKQSSCLHNPSPALLDLCYGVLEKAVGELPAGKTKIAMDAVAAAIKANQPNPSGTKLTDDDLKKHYEDNDAKENTRGLAKKIADAYLKEAEGNMRVNLQASVEYKLALYLAIYARESCDGSYPNELKEATPPMFFSGGGYASNDTFDYDKVTYTCKSQFPRHHTHWDAYALAILKYVQFGFGHNEKATYDRAFYSAEPSSALVQIVADMVRAYFRKNTDEILYEKSVTSVFKEILKEYCARVGRKYNKDDKKTHDSLLRYYHKSIRDLVEAGMLGDDKLYNYVNGTDGWKENKGFSDVTNTKAFREQFINNSKHGMYIEDSAERVLADKNVVYMLERLGKTDAASYKSYSKAAFDNDAPGSLYVDGSVPHYNMPGFYFRVDDEHRKVQTTCRQKWEQRFENVARPNFADGLQMILSLYDVANMRNTMFFGGHYAVLRKYHPKVSYGLFYSDFMNYISSRHQNSENDYAPLINILNGIFSNDVDATVKTLLDPQATKLSFDVARSFVASPYFMYNMISTLHKAPKALTSYGDNMKSAAAGLA